VDRLLWLDAKGDLARHSGYRRRPLPAKAAGGMHEHSHLLVTRPGKTHLGRCTADTAIHLGDRNSPPRLQLDLIEQPG
jgi:hypothetical protein